MTSAVVLGAGALGSIYASALVAAGCDVTVLARPAHVAAIADAGLRLVRVHAGTEETVRLGATSDPRRLPTPRR